MLLKTAFVLICLSPMAILILIRSRERRRERASRKDPFLQPLLRPPGESVRLRIRELEEQFQDRLLSFVMTPVFAAVIAILYFDRLGETFPIIPIYVGATIGLAIFLTPFGRKMLRVGRELRDHKLGFQGERHVGEELNALMREGFHVFHDLPFDGFNIDHVIVGPPGVYVVETKARRKMVNAKNGKADYRIYYDGTNLTFPHTTDNHGIDQAKRNADTLASWLTSATGERVSVEPILTFPGWWVERTGRGRVHVVNPKEIRKIFPKHPARPLPEDQIRRINHQLEQKCRNVVVDG